MSKFGVVFLVLLLTATVSAAVRTGAAYEGASSGRRVVANERLTALTGALLFILLVALGVTILFIRRFLSLHYLVGFALVPPLAVKLYSTGYRFIRYYARDSDFRLAGAPQRLLRFAIAPILVASSVAVMASGLELWAFGDRFGTWWISAHTATAVVFIAATFMHLLGHLRRSAIAAAQEKTIPSEEGALTRRSILIACAILALAIAVASMSYASPFDSGVG
jgi:hypothetical protein